MTRRIYWKRNASGRGRGLNSGYLVTPWLDLAYRGFRGPLFQLRPMRLGDTKLYTLGPVALFWKGKTS